jgi:uncharacterized membrane protein
VGSKALTLHAFAVAFAVAFAFAVHIATALCLALALTALAQKPQSAFHNSQQNKNLSV